MAVPGPLAGMAWNRCRTGAERA